MRAWTLFSALSVAVGVAAAVTPTEASACGGTFCDAGPSSMPVDQSGENILFVMDGRTVEAHVQIQYQGDPDQFAWIVPVMALPEIEAGSAALFQNMLDATVPTFVTNPVFESCGPDDNDMALGCDADSVASADGSLSGDTDGFGGEPDFDPEVVASGVAGAFEYSVLEGGTVDGVVAWLDENGYAQDDEAPAELQAYLDKGFLFVAFKLRGGTGVDEIHPVVIRYEGDEPCVPIRLTRIAATDDMGVRAFFLGEARVAPTNYRSVEINLAAIDWNTLGSNYESVVTRAVDWDEQGHGFVTEYAGNSGVVESDGLFDSRWQSQIFREADPDEAIAELDLQGLLACEGNSCMPAHPLIEGLLGRFLPRPVGVTFEAYYGCVSCYEDADLESWDPSAFADELHARIIAPGQHALELLESHDYLTRLYTTLSPQEMTLDPIFHVNPDLPVVSNVHTVDLVFPCEGPNYVEFEDGSRLALSGSVDPDQPAALRLEDVPEQGPPMMLLDLSADIVAARADWNDAQGLQAGGGEEGCNCRARKSGASGVVWAVFMVGMGLWGRRRRWRRATPRSR
ncbi:MAG: DUF2330 domain-containing protein [Nannocystaceae bacterium]|nr:DUF2330 domain-containing protein [bacterium]